MRTGKPLGSHAFDVGTAWGSRAGSGSQTINNPCDGRFRQSQNKICFRPQRFKTPGTPVIIAIGYQGDPEALPADLLERERPSDRRPLKEFVFEGTFESDLRCAHETSRSDPMVAWQG